MAKRSGKYSQVLGGLPTLGIDPSRREAVTQAQEQIRQPSRCGDCDSDISVGHYDGCVQEHRPLREWTPFQILQVLQSNIAELIELKKHQTAGRPYAAEYARAYAECRAIRDTIAEWDGAFSLLVEAFQWLMIDAMSAEGMLTADGKGSLTANGQPIHTYREPVAKVEDPELYRQWCDADSDLRRKMMLWPSTTNALAKARLLAGEDAPPGVTVSAKTVVRLGAGDE